MSVWLHRLDFHIKCYITMILKKTIAFPCYQESLLVDSAWPCPPPGFSGLMLSLFKSLLLTFQMFLFSLPQKPISLYFIKKSILAMSFASFRAFISKKPWRYSNNQRTIHSKSETQATEKTQRHLWSVRLLCLLCCLYPGHCGDLFTLMRVMPQSFHLLVLN